MSVSVGVRVTSDTSKAVSGINEVGSAAQKTAATVTTAGRTASAGLAAASGGAATATSSVGRFAITAGKLAKIMAGTGLLVYAQQFLPISDNALAAVQIFGGLAVAIGKQLNLFSKLGSQLQTFGAAIMRTALMQRIATVAQIAWNAAVAAFPVILIVAAIIAVIAGLVLLYNKVSWFRGAVNAVWSAVQTAAVAVFHALVAAFNFVAAALAPLVGAFTTAFGIIRTIVSVYLAYVIGLFRVFMAAIRGAVSVVVAVITAPFRAAFAVLQGIVQVAIAILTGHFSRIPGIISGALGGVLSALTSPFRAAWDAVKGIFEAAASTISGIMDRITGIVSGAINVAKTAWNGFASVWNAIQITLPKVKIPLGPTLGGQTLGLPDLPMLAHGGVVSKATLAVVGEGGREIVAPETLLRSIVAEGSGGGVVNLKVTVNVPPASNPAEVGRETARVLAAFARANGSTALGRRLGLMPA